MSPRVNSWSISRGVLPLGLLMCRIFDYCAAEMLGRIISRLTSVKLRYFCRHKQQLKDRYAKLFKLMASSFIGRDLSLRSFQEILVFCALVPSRHPRRLWFTNPAISQPSRTPMINHVIL
ncbi:Uncharacterized protein HZ326_24630 [Fusarium oxysporum f. sp. albedinis]|nr:Uncharacterized protein HZ326_24630 [Fusarium oxysporum f. sp. albedinis]